MFNEEITILDLAQRFNTQEKCIMHLEELYWEGVPISPFDSESKVYKCKNGKYRCSNTKKYFDVTTNTLFHGTQVELPKWFMAIYIVTSNKRGISSAQLARDLKVSQKTAWYMLQRIRACFGIENQQPMGGIVEADEAMVGGKQKNRHKNKRISGAGGRSTADKDAVFGMVERGGRIALIAVPDCETDTLQPIVKKLVESGSVLVTDSWNGYNGLDSDYLHYMIKDSSKGYDHDYNPEIHTNNIEGAWKHVKGAVSGTYNHVSTKHLQLYLDESSYRWNTKGNNQGYRFNYLLCNMGTRTKYRILTQWLD